MTEKMTDILEIAGKFYGGSHGAYLIAEVGTNHQGSLQRAKDYISASADAGANAVKFQSWHAEKLHNINDVLVDGSLATSKALPILQQYQLPEEWHGELSQFASENGIDFLSTPFDLESAELLNELSVPAYKIASGDLTYKNLINCISGIDRPVLLSTGMASLGEIESALEWLCYPVFKKIALLHCVASYPPEIADANLNALHTLREAFGLPIGFSDHYPGWELTLAAIAKGATVIEKHVTFSRDDKAPDSPFAITLDEFSSMVKAVRSLELALGDGRKRCMPCEEGGLIGGRRSIFAVRDMDENTIITEHDLAIVRPNRGDFQPADIDRVVGARTKVKILAGTPIYRKDLD